MRVEGRATASSSAAGQLQRQMAEASGGVNFGGEIERTWRHEMDHFMSDTKGSGEFGYVMEVEVSEGLVVASWICYYMPFGERTPQEMMKIASAPGFSDMSSQDKMIYDMAFKNWKAKIDEALNSAGRDSGNNNSSDKIPALEAIPKKGDEGDGEYLTRAELVEIFAEKLNLLSDEGRIPDLKEILSSSITDFMETGFNEIQKAYYEALSEAGKKKEKNKPFDVNSVKTEDGGEEEAMAVEISGEIYQASYSEV